MWDLVGIILYVRAGHGIGIIYYIYRKGLTIYVYVYYMHHESGGTVFWSLLPPRLIPRGYNLNTARTTSPPIWIYTSIHYIYVRTPSKTVENCARRGLLPPSTLRVYTVRCGNTRRNIGRISPFLSHSL